MPDVVNGLNSIPGIDAAAQRLVNGLRSLFPAQLEGLPKSISEYGVSYTIYRAETPSLDATIDLLLEQLRPDIEGGKSILVWRSHPTIWREMKEGKEIFGAMMRAHTMTPGERQAKQLEAEAEIRASQRAFPVRPSGNSDINPFIGVRADDGVALKSEFHPGSLETTEIEMPAMRGRLFDQALHALRNGFRVRRAGWNGKGMWLQYIGPHEVGYNWRERPTDRTTTFKTSAFILMKAADDTLVPWLASQTDLLAADWEIAE